MQTDGWALKYYRVPLHVEEVCYAVLLLCMLTLQAPALTAIDELFRLLTDNVRDNVHVVFSCQRSVSIP